MGMTSRLTYGMADEALLPKRRTPWVGILATTLVARVLTGIGDLSTLAEMVVVVVVVVVLFVFISTNAAVIALRREPVAHGHFRCAEHRALPRYRVVPAADDTAKRACLGLGRLVFGGGSEAVWLGAAWPDVVWAGAAHRITQ